MCLIGGAAAHQQFGWPMSDLLAVDEFRVGELLTRDERFHGVSEDEGVLAVVEPEGEFVQMVVVSPSVEVQDFKDWAALALIFAGGAMLFIVGDVT